MNDWFPPVSSAGRKYIRRAVAGFILTAPPPHTWDATWHWMASIFVEAWNARRAAAYLPERLRGEAR